MSNLSFNQVHRFFQSQLRELIAPGLSRCRQFYKVCPEILGSLTQELQSKDRLFISKYKLNFPSEQELRYTYE